MTPALGAPADDEPNIDGQAWTLASVENLGLTTDVETAAAVLGIGRTNAYKLARSGAFPVPVIKIGRLYRVPVHAILSLLGPGHANRASHQKPEDESAKGPP